MYLVSLPFVVMAKASSDLKFLMDEAGVSVETQAKVYTRGFMSVRIFSGLDDTKEKVRAALCKELPLDYEADAAARVDMALLLSVWGVLPHTMDCWRATPC
eukprot:s1024_g27.t1